MVWCGVKNTWLLVCSADCLCSHFQLQPPSSLFEAKLVLHLYWSRPAQCILVAHHAYWVPCGPRINCAGSRSRLDLRGTVCMTHRRVVMLWHLLIQSPAALQVNAYRQRLGERNSEIKLHSPSYGLNSLTVCQD